MKKQASKYKLAMETLEDRTLCAAGVWVSDHMINIQATNHSDTVTISVNPGIEGLGDDKIVVKWKHDGLTETSSFDRYRIESDGGGLLGYPVTDIYGVNFTGGDGNDTVTNNSDVPSFMAGGKGNDTFYGGSVGDKLEGGLGSDKLYGRGGNDYLFANIDGFAAVNAATDYLFGGEGDDHLKGGAGGTNFLNGDKGYDTLTGGDIKGFNFMYGGTGNDTYFGGTGTPGKPASVINHIVDSSGRELIWGGDYATNIAFIVDATSLSPDDVYHKSFKGTDNVIYNPLKKIGNLEYGDRILDKIIPGYF